MQRFKRKVRRIALVIVLAFFSQAIPDLDEIPMIWKALTAPIESMEVAEAADNEN